MVKDSEIQWTVIPPVARSGRGLTAAWSGAILAGAAAAVALHGSWSALMLQAAQCPVCWSGSLTVTLTPFLLSLLLAVLLGRTGIWMVCLTEGFLLGLASAAAGQCCSGGALMAGLLLFSAVASAPVLLMLWRQLLRTQGRFSERLLFAAGLLAAIAAADVLVVSPFLGEVINF